MVNCHQRIRTWAALAVVVICCSVIAHPLPATSADSDLDLARALFQEGDYYRAITEAKRFLFLHPTDSRKWEVSLLIGQAYWEQGQPAAARGALRPVAEQRDRPDLTVQAMMMIGQCLERTDSHAAQAYYFQLTTTQGLPPANQFNLRNQARYRQGWVLVELGRFEQAAAVFRQVEDHHQLKVSATSLSVWVRDGTKIEPRSPALAGILSAVLPGVGQLYTGHLIEAAIAFGLNLIFILAVIQAWRARTWLVLILLLIMEIGWYGGNIYNAVNGVHIYNREAREAFVKQLQKKIPVGQP